MATKKSSKPAKKKAGTGKTAPPQQKGKSASLAVDEQLEMYRSMRDFEVTAEPSGGKPKPPAQTNDLPFVIQKHAATRLHYDFRLGWRGVLKSWAVAKGPSYFTGDKRLAVQVEDHPIEYGGFEGTIPKGQYGGGTVMLWDNGTWAPHGDADEGFRTGRLKFELHGKKMKGNWTLVRMGGKAAEERKPNWLLIKEHDEFERPAEDKPITEEAPDSVVTGRNLDQIASDEDHIWNSKDTATIDDKTPAPVTKPEKSSPSAKAGKKKVTTAATKALSAISSRINELPREAMPKFIPPQLTIQTKEAPRGEGWIHELKLDGYRIQIHIDKKGKDVRLYTRSGLDWTRRMPAVAESAARLPVTSALLDGEVVVLRPDGSTSFADLQAAFQDHAPHPMTYFAFDLLHLDGHNLRSLPLLERKELLAGILPGEPDETLRFSEHFEQQGSTVFDNACRLGAEGIISKRADAAYTSGRSPNWIKIKCVRQQEFVVGGFTLPGDKGDGLGSLLLGYYENGKLVYAGRTGTGFTHQFQRDLRRRLEKMKVKDPAYASVPAEGRKGAIWVRPDLVAEVAFATWTADKLVRQAAFKGLREDKKPKEVTIELPRDTAEVQQEAEEAAPQESARQRVHAKAVAKTASKKSAAKSAGTLSANIRLTHPDKIIDAATGVTKQQLADYYAAVVDHMMPHLADRPLSLVRCPEGVGHPCFFQKHIGQGVPDGIGSVPIKDKKGATEEYLTLTAPEGLVGLAQMGVLEVHPWGSRSVTLETPDMLIFDLDPDEAIGWETLTAAAQEIRKRLKKLGLESFVKTTGGKGLHVVAPIVPKHDWTAIKAFARGFAEQVEKSDPDLYLIKMTKAARKGKIFLDYLRNERGATAVAPFSPRARPGVHVALPLSWNDLKTKPEFSVANFDDWKTRLARDPWARMWDLKQPLTDEAVAMVSDK
ncbi:bifunctional non-homologous end joining protein LigD [Silvibacterium bohemicum]|uniref:DNA ligase (ATP) n=1 Tax=Silvibacterium bohemicum TaxID=1577686 RepID=A0A841K002_9BACT|nr:DNA ligase D [Silvibacterium bohemicum]MBB6143998.1 bifunctional non-homologous end joining protein LigD [Silvibacterium bohemicum]